MLCRIVCGPTVLAANEGVVRRAASAQRLTIAWTPERVKGWDSRFRKTLSSGSRPEVSSRSAFNVSGQSGHVRSFRPFPTIYTLREYQSRSAILTCTASLARAPEL